MVRENLLHREYPGVAVSLVEQRSWIPEEGQQNVGISNPVRLTVFRLTSISKLRRESTSAYAFRELRARLEVASTTIR
jgi:hypothetical protein